MQISRAKLEKQLSRIDKDMNWLKEQMDNATRMTVYNWENRMIPKVTLIALCSILECRERDILK